MTEQPLLVLIDNYDSFTYNLVQYFGEIGANILVFRNDKISLDELIASMRKLQSRLMANDRRSLLVVFQALDAAGQAALEHDLAGLLARFNTARDGSFVEHEKVNPKMEQWTDDVVRKLVHAPGSPNLAARLWPAA